MAIQKLTASMLRYNCDPDVFNFENTAEMEPIEGIIGQERATKALEFGLRVKSKAYNIFVAGITGTGKTSYITSVIKGLAVKGSVADDWCYIYNFKDPDSPISVSLPAGMGEIFVKDMEKFINGLQREIPLFFSGEDYQLQANQLLSKYHDKVNEILNLFEKQAKEKGVILRKTDKGLAVIPLINGKPIDEQEGLELDEAATKEMQQRIDEVQQELERVTRQIRELDKEQEQQLEQLERELALNIITPELDKLSTKYYSLSKIISYLNQVKEDLLNNLDMFKIISKKKEANQDAKGSGTTGKAIQNFISRYAVNLFVNHSLSKGAPVESESNPTYYNLFGKIEGKPYLNSIVSDFSTVKSGAVHRANGGYLIIQAADLLKDPVAWDALKRTIQNSKAVIENIGEQYKAIPSTTVKPEPIPLSVKVILIGSPTIYNALYNYDEDFQKLFKIKVQFDTVMELKDKSLHMYAQFISSVCRRENLLHFHRSAVAKVIEASLRLAEHQKELSTRFNHVVELIYESVAWAEMEGSHLVLDKHVQKTLLEKINRANLLEDKVHDKILSNNILIATEGSGVGQINGLTVYNMGDHTFGMPARITARCYIGEKGIINIEREAKMSGSIHDKGVLILQGYLGGQYALDKPLSLSASICFEQSYGGVDGDSASCAELVAIISSLSGVPIKQNIAITGSMNQMGDVQPIGGVNQKIEGFFRLCKEKGFKGDYAVIIPIQNQPNLMLNEEVVEAVGKGQFNIYAIKHIDEAIELLTGMKAKDIHVKVNERLVRMNTENIKLKTI
ncbi:MAG: ATP-binding protein [Bacillota bacterium]|nr:ATP-binding protein [Bacillota bacterium]